MMTLAQLSGNLKSQAVQNPSIIQEQQPDRPTYRFIQIRGGSFRSKFKETRIQLNDINNVNYDFRRPSIDSTDEQTSAQFKVA